MRLELVLDLLRRRLVDWTLRDSDVGLIQHGVELSRRQKAIIIFISPLGLMRPVRKCSRLHAEASRRAPRHQRDVLNEFYTVCDSSRCAAKLRKPFPALQTTLQSGHVAFGEGSVTCISE